MSTPAPFDAAARHAQHCRIVDTSDESLRGLPALASRLCGTTAAYIALDDEERRALSLPATALTLPCPADLSDTISIPDATQDPTFAGHPLVAGPPHLRLIAAAPLRRANGDPIGVLCVGSTMVGALNAEQRDALRFAAEQIVTHFELRRAMMEIDRLRHEHRRNDELMRDSGQLLTTLLREVPLGVFILDGKGHPYYTNARAVEILGRGVLAGAEVDELAEAYDVYVAGTDRPYPVEDMPVVRALRGESGWADDIEIRSPAGRRFVEVFSSPVRGVDGAVQFAIAAFSDITRRRELERRLAAESQAMALLSRVAIAANESSTVNEALAAAIAEVCEISGWSVGHAWLLGPEGDGFYSSGVWHVDDPQRYERFVRLTKRLHMKKGHGLPGIVAMEKQPWWIADIADESCFTRSLPEEPPGVRSALGVPVLVDGEVAAVLEFFSATRREIDRPLVDVMQSVGAQLGHVIQRKRAEHELAQSEARFRDLVENSPELICMHDLHGVILSANPASIKALGCNSAEEVIGKSIVDFLAPEVRNQYPAYISEIVSKGHSKGLLRLVTRSGEQRVWEYHNTLRGIEPGAQLVRGMARDVTERQRIQRLLAESESRYRLLFERNVAGVFVTNLEGQVLDCNPAFARMFDFVSPTEVLVRHVEDFYADRAGARADVERLSGQKELTNHEVLLRRRDGTTFWALANVTFVDAPEPAERRYFGTLVDISAQKELEARMAFQAFHDSLTGLPNRAMLSNVLRHDLAFAQRHRKMTAVCFLDLDGFKPVNDEHGHAVGDALLSEVAHRLQQLVRGSDTVARIGGDEFVIVVNDLTGPRDVLPFVDRVLAALRQPFVIDGHQLLSGGSIGISFYPDDGEEPSELIRRADRAMYEAKAAGRGTWRAFDQNLLPA